MLIINWKKHYNIPTIFYNDTRFTSTRKGKFFFLSDFVFRIIHKFCFRISLFYYMKYLFFNRFQKICKHVNKYLFSPYFYFREYRLNWTMNDLKIRQKVLLFQIKRKQHFLLHFYFFISTYFFIKVQIIKNKNVIFYLKNEFFYNLFIKKIINLIFLKFYIFFKWINNKKKHIFSTNYIFLLYQLKKQRFFLKKYIFFFSSKYHFKLIYKKYIINFYSMSKELKKQSFLLKKKYTNSIEKFKIKNIFYNPLKKNYLIYFNFFINNFHQLFYYFFSLKKIYSYKSLNFINYVNLNNLVLKKEFFYKFKKLFRSFRNKFKRFRLFYMKRFYRFLVHVLYSKKNWLVGPKHKFKFFKYIFLIFRKIKKSFKKLYFLNNPKLKKKKKMSFYLNSLKIREHLFYYLGKNRYKEEFILLKNKKWYFKFYLKQYFNIDLRNVINFYVYLRKHFKVKLIKDLFLFLEYNITIFTKKYIFFSFNLNYDIKWNELSLNNHSINTDNKNIFFIGDCIKMNNIDFKFKYYYEKLFIFFNIIFYINPFFYKKKFTFLIELYNKLYNYVRNHFLKRHFLSIKNQMTFYNKKYISKYINYFIKILNKNSYKLFIKSLFFFIFKFNFLYNKEIQNVNDTHNYFFESWNFNNLINVYSFCKYYNKYPLIQLNYLYQRNKKTIRKPLFIFKDFKEKFIRRKKRKWILKELNLNIYNYLYRNMTPSSNKVHFKIYNKSFIKRWNASNYNTKILKQMFYLKKKNKFFNLFYNYNF